VRGEQSSQGKVGERLFTTSWRLLTLLHKADYAPPQFLSHSSTSRCYSNFQNLLRNLYDTITAYASLAEVMGSSVFQTAYTDRVC
jgi:hypothetical protein